MDDRKLQELIRQASPQTWERSPECPDEHAIAACYDGTIQAPARETLELHLADCERCTLLIGALSRLEIETAEGVSAETLERARRLVPAGPTRTFRYTPHLAAAAVLVLAVGVFFNVRQDTAVQPEPDYRTTRSVATSSQLEVLSPVPGAGVHANQLEVRWSEIVGTRYYVVRIVSSSGALVTEQRVSSAEWRPGPELRLEAGQEYYVRVEAFPTFGPSTGSRHVPFTVRATP
jgi:hypothetical protein